MSYREYVHTLRCYWEVMKSAKQNFQLKYELIKYVAKYGESICVNR